ncbi:aldehyde dehydrogenase family protein [Candidatus Micrarchaeota archaeon]|nr:aldehyde dehydrogenase family protein [Candidatus Micrarchaeota archaeon]
MTSTYKMYINGKWVSASDNDTFEVYNPANSQLLAYVAKGTRNDVHTAIDAAREAFDSGVWSSKTPGERSTLLWKLAELVEKNSLQLAKLESQNVGKTIKYARDSDLPFIIDNLKFFAGAARMLTGLSSADYSGLGTSFLRREPVGVVGSIIPWNYPLYIAIWKLAPALAAGNTLVLKPASYTPLTLLEFTRLVEKIIPKGVFNVVTGPGEIIGSEIASSKKVDMISLTGDTKTGKKIMQLASNNVKKVHLELGGKAPLIVMSDADLDMAAKGATVGAFWNTGQDCTAVTRVYVHKKYEKKLISLILNEMRKIRLGDPLNENTDMGPLISARQRDNVANHIRSGIDEGAELVCGGQRPSGKQFENGYYIVPALFRNVQQKMKICQEEIFGPVLSVSTYEKIDEAIEKANDVDYGLAASVYGKDITTAIKIANKLRFGTVWINEHGALTSETPHGGFKQSGFGKDLSIYSLEEYTNLKHVYIDQTGLARKPWHYTVYGKQ